MRTSSVLVAFLAAASSGVLAQQDMPKIYFPRHMKRHFINATITQTEPHSAPLPTSFSSDDSTTQSTSFLSEVSSEVTERSDSSNSDDGTTTIVLDQTVYISPPESTSSSGSSDTAATTTTDNFLDLPTISIALPISLGLTNATTATESSSPTATVTTSSSGILLLPTAVVTPTPTSSTSDGGLLGGVSSILSAVLDPSVNSTTADVSSSTITANSGTGTGVTATPTSTGGLLGISLSLPPILGTTTSTPTMSVSVSTVSVNSTTVSEPGPTVSVNSTSVTTLPTDTSSLPLGSVTPTTTPSVPISVNASSIPSTASTQVPISIPLNGTSTPSSAHGSTVTPASTTTPATELPTSTSAVSTSATSSEPEPWLPTTIVIAPSPTSSPSNPDSTATSSQSTGLPTGLPSVITPEGGNDPTPGDMMEIQIAFNYALNYPFVASHSQAASQIVKLLPEALAYEGGFAQGQSVVKSINPLDTTSELGFITALAIVTYPKELVNQLQMDILIPNSKVYENPDTLVANMTHNINPAIGILLGDTLSSSGGSGSTTSSSSNSGSNNDAFGNNASSSSQSSSQMGTTAGIAIGSVGVAATYGAAMFVIARRYKRRKQAHRRASSITNPSEMRQTGSPALMGGALLSRDFSSYGGVAGGRNSHGSGRSGAGNSARTAVISAPVAAENSLGWN